MEVSKSLRQTYSNSTTHNHYVVGIGFSAGGLDALIKYFDHTPLDGASYIVIQHLPYEYKSRMLEILSKHSSLQVMEITEGMVVTPNCVYLMPDRKAVHIRGGSLYLSDIEKKYPNTAIDVFLDSLARDVKNKSIGIILSGAGTDGTKGVASINKAGGLVIVQEPETALYSSMPSSAIDSGCVHMVLTPEKMPEAVIDYISQASLMEKYGKHLEEADEKALQDILDIVKEKTPLDFSNYKRLTLLKRIIKRMAAHEIESLQQYVNILDFNPTEVERLAQEFLINVTHFFRDSNAFEVISTQVIPEIVENKLHIDPIKVWVVGCATGEEAYSLAILFMEYLSEHGKDIEVKIFASDVDQEAIAFASRGRYSINIAHQVSEQRLQKYFVREGAYYRV
ncbi:MAG TPA: chemotaxis protein CheB, partial [Cytophagales bacterium]|nr:chemotaxis protein CheB [Cytophagales bacterium]